MQSFPKRSLEEAEGKSKKTEEGPFPTPSWPEGLSKPIGSPPPGLGNEKGLCMAIDLKSFFASVECRERGLDPLDTNLVVADEERTEKTICLAVTPSLKRYGISGRARLFEVIEKVKEKNAERKRTAPQKTFTGSSFSAKELDKNPALFISYIVAPPRISLYRKYSSLVYNVYLKYFAPEDIAVYSVDEVFINAKPYLKTMGLSGKSLAEKVMKDVLLETGISSAAGVGTNIYLAKVAMDIEAKKIKIENGAMPIAELTEESYKEKLWRHRPLSSFWNLGPGYEKKLEENGLFTMEDIAKCSLGKPEDFHNRALLKKLFGKASDELIEHAWGRESRTVKYLNSYRPKTKSVGSGQVLSRPYAYEEAEIIVKEMAEALALEMTSKGLVSKKIVLSVGYDTENLKAPGGEGFTGETEFDRYGREVPKHARGTASLGNEVSSQSEFKRAALSLFSKIASKKLLIRRINISAENVKSAESSIDMPKEEQLSFFKEISKEKSTPERPPGEDLKSLEEEKRVQEAVLKIKEKYGRGAILKGMSLQDCATEKERSARIRGHRA